MIAENDLRRCPTCQGIHLAGGCPLLILEPRLITDEEDARTRAFLARYGLRRRKR